jgi:hypothetical protein
MRKLNAERAGRDVHLSSSASVSVVPGYHKILRTVKRHAPAATCWGRGNAYGIVKEIHAKWPTTSARSQVTTMSRKIEILLAL